MPKTIRSPGLLALGAAIVRIRTTRGMSQAEFAESLGYQQSFIAKIELGNRRLDVVELVLLARAMKADPVELLNVVQRAVCADDTI
ncbi:helix-turn-helix transcriptional regulator [Tropicimonas sp. TH_r6]|uniref:helix-turn-helix domain-containing protein n=1 Tax=Tropicimonas sp. TH_r6 TaxID=3082085 RepID=UPI00295501AB|nr:helix-turn-helix transcriptional regulator [Tropicimonas sp. TH_r6]MDV7143521.1 helix-turn-helix transcriptional regulator [Tropicimonas sp. TH_r6]